MLGSRRLIIDTWSEVYDLLKPYADGEFWDFAKEEIDTSAIYVIGRLQLKENLDQVTKMVNQRPGCVIFCNPAEGSQTIKLQMSRLGIHELVRQRKLLLLTSGDLEEGYYQFSTDGYFTNIVEYLENQAAATHDVFAPGKPYDFLFLNGRLRPHRKYMLSRFRELGLLDRSLWTCLEEQVSMASGTRLTLDIDLEEIKLLPAQYEIERAIPQLDLPKPDRDVKHFLFNDTWGDAIVNPNCYTDTCFSVVTETIYEYPYTFRTEKIWKPILMAHPWIAVANKGYYRDMHKAGFQTFGKLIDESFDLIDNSQDRIERIISTVNDIVQNGSEAFLQTSRNICKYNQQHLVEYNRQQRAELPIKLLDHINERSRISSTTT